MKNWLPVSCCWSGRTEEEPPAAAAAAMEAGKNHGCCLVGDREGALEEAADREESELHPDEEEKEEPAEFLLDCLHRRLLRHSLLELMVICLAEVVVGVEDDPFLVSCISWARPPSLVARWKALNVCRRFLSAARGRSLRIAGLSRCCCLLEG